MDENKGCELEGRVISAVRGDGLSAEIAEHIAGCETCGEAAFLTSALCAEARNCRDLESLPDPQYLWTRAEMERRRAVANRVTWPLTLVRRIALASGVAAVIVAFGRTLPSLAGLVMEWLDGPVTTGWEPGHVSVGGLFVLALYALGRTLEEAWGTD